MKKKIISYLADGIAAGIILTIGCAANISADSKFAGAFLFSIGLFAIINFKFGLYTGKAGYMALRPYSYIGEVVLTLIGNFIGAAVAGSLLSMAFTDLYAGASKIMETKITSSPATAAIAAVFCGILMFTAVEGNRHATEKSDFVGGLFMVVMPVMAFIICGFNHSIADFGYFFLSRAMLPYEFLPYIVLVILGNALGCMIIPTIKKFSENKL